MAGKKKHKGPIKVGKKFKRVMSEYGDRTLHHGGTGEVVTDVKMATAIAASEQRKADKGKRKSKRSSRRKRSRSSKR